MRNYFNYYTEIEERFQQRRGTLLMLTTLDWALIETWREAGVPLEAVLRGIDNAFDKHDAKALRSLRQGHAPAATLVKDSLIRNFVLLRLSTESLGSNLLQFLLSIHRSGMCRAGHGMGGLASSGNAGPR